MPHPVKNFRQRYRMQILSRFFVRWHMTLILAAVIASGAGVSKLLLACGMTEVRFRYPVAVIVSYAVFFLLVRIWIWYVTPDRGEIDPSDFDMVEAALPESDGGWLPDVDGDDAAWLLAALAFAIMAICGAGAYLVYIAPELLPEAALQIALASGLARASFHADRGGWISGVFRATWIPFVSVLALVVVLALAIHHNCPQATKLAEALDCPG